MFSCSPSPTCTHFARLIIGVKYDLDGSTFFLFNWKQGGGVQRKARYSGPLFECTAPLPDTDLHGPLVGGPKIHTTLFFLSCDSARASMHISNARAHNGSGFLAISRILLHLSALSPFR